mgnify:FL=1
MIITCPSCDKKFNVDASLIPQEGRTLQCGFCEHKWFFKTENTEEEITVLEKKISKPVIEDNKNLSENINEDITDEEDHDKESVNSSKEELDKKVSKKKDANYFKILIVIIISFIALILILETFKVQLSIIIPNIEIVLDNLYQSINDIKLFVLDLIN